MKAVMFKLSDELADSENGGRYDPKKNGEPPSARRRHA
jgi:hypothetical protein